MPHTALNRKAVICYHEDDDVSEDRIPDLLYHEAFREVPIHRPRPPEDEEMRLLRSESASFTSSSPHRKRDRDSSSSSSHLHRLSQSFVSGLRRKNPPSLPQRKSLFSTYNSRRLLGLLLLMFLVIGLVSLVIYLYFSQEYSNHINRLKSELQTAREKSGVYLTKENYLSMIKKDESQEKEITDLIQKIRFLESESDKIKELFSQTKSRLGDTTKERDASRDLLECTKNMLSQITAEKEEQIYLVARHVETECELKGLTNTLITVSDESTRDPSEVHDNLDRIRKFESHNAKTTKHFQSSFQSQYSQLEESFHGQVMAQSKFCAQTRDILSSLLYERTGHKVAISEGFTQAIHSILSLIADIEKSLADNVYEEQSWVNAQMKVGRNAADAQQKKLQAYLMDKVLPELSSISTAIMDQKSTTLETSNQIHTLVNSQVDRWEKYVENQKELNTKSLELIREVGVSREKHLSDLEVNQKGLHDRNEALSADLASLLSSVESFSLRVKSHTSEARNEFQQNTEIIQAVRSEGNKMISGAETLVDSYSEQAGSHLYKLSLESSSIKQKSNYLMDSMKGTFDILAPAEEALAREAKEFVSSAQDDLEKNYSELEHSLRHKSDSSADHLKILSTKAQDMRTCTLDSQRALEDRLESHRAMDQSQTQAVVDSIGNHCLATATFGKSHGHELRDSGQSVIRFLSKEFKRDSPTNRTPFRKPLRAYPQKIHRRTPDPVRLFRGLRASSKLSANEKEQKKGGESIDHHHHSENEVNFVISSTSSMKSKDQDVFDEDSSKENLRPQKERSLS